MDRISLDELYRKRSSIRKSLIAEKAIRCGVRRPVGINPATNIIRRAACAPRRRPRRLRGHKQMEQSRGSLRDIPPLPSQLKLNY